MKVSSKAPLNDEGTKTTQAWADREAAPERLPPPDGG